jgi:hypothetical protein
MLLNISPPPLAWGAIEYAVIAGAVVVGLLLMLWGRALGRVILGVAAAAAGVLLAAPLLAQVDAVKSMGLDINIIRAAAGLVAGAAAMIAARLVWGAAGGAFFGLIAVGLLLAFAWPAAQSTAAPAAARASAPAATEHSVRAALEHADASAGSPAAAPAPTLGAWSLDLLQSAWQAFLARWNDKALYIVLALVLPVGVPIFVGMIRPRFGVIFMTSLLGATLLTLGVLALAVEFHPAVWDAANSHIYVPLAVAVLGFAIAMAYQYRSAKAAAAQAKKSASPPAPKPDAAKKK